MIIYNTNSFLYQVISFKCQDGIWYLIVVSSAECLNLNAPFRIQYIVCRFSSWLVILEKHADAVNILLMIVAICMGLYSLIIMQVLNIFLCFIMDLYWIWNLDLYLSQLVLQYHGQCTVIAVYIEPGFGTFDIFFRLLCLWFSCDIDTSKCKNLILIS